MTSLLLAISSKKGSATIMANEFKLWLEYEHYEPELDAEVGFFNMIIRMPSGEEHALTVWTFKYLDFFRQWCEGMNLHLNGKYAPTPDLFVTRMDRQHLEEVVSDLLAHNNLNPAWLMPQ